jgi:hypothetical protein
MNKVNVFCRIRPSVRIYFSNSFLININQNETSSINKIDNHTISLKYEKSDGLSFNFDHIFNNCDQINVFQEISPMISDALKGYNATIFTYGQTGSGKTFTMYGVPGGQDRGIVARVIEDILKYAADNANDNVFDIRFSCLELYQEKLIDLMQNTNEKAETLRIRQHPSGGVWVEVKILYGIILLLTFHLVGFEREACYICNRFQ